MEKQEIDIQTRNELFKQHISPLLDYVRLVCKARARSPNDVDDLYNESLTILFKGIHTYNPSYPIKPWVATVVRNHIRKRNTTWKQMTDEYVDIEGIASNLFYYDWELDQNFNDELPQTMMTALDMLVPAQRAAIMLMLQSYTVDDISRKLFESGLIKNRNENVAKTLLFRAKKNLSKFIDRDGNLIVKPPRKPRGPRPAKLTITDNFNVNPQKNDTMAKLKSDVDKYISLHENEYLELIEDQMMIKALKVAGIEDLPIYKAADAILRNSRVEIHLKPIQSNYR